MKKRRLGLILSAAALSGAVVFLSGSTKSESSTFSISKNLDVFNSIIKELDMFYVDTLDAQKTIREGINSMLYSLDPYTVYYPEEDQASLEQMLRNSYGGIGSVITWNAKEDRAMISEPYEHMPAAEVGLKAGDIILEIDGEDMKGQSTQTVSDKLRGQIGTDFRLKVRRPGQDEPLEFQIQRKSIELPLISYSTVLKDSVGYIHLSTFSGNPSKEFKTVFTDLKFKGITSLVIDLRNNGGGLLNEATEIANFFLPRGKVLVTTKGKAKQTGLSYKTLRDPLDLDIPIAVLVNSGTASSSEILAGSLQDLDRAVIVGERTYGKGLVQTTRNLPYGGTLKLTTSKYYIPSGRCVQAIDYTHRNEDGSVGRIPDSLTTVFHTQAGREVRDGGGVKPDIEVEGEKVPNIVYYLVSDNLIFDFATQFCLTHQSVAPAEDFSLTDEDFRAFKEFVSERDFKYDQQTEKMLKNLKELAEFEGYLSDASDEFNALEAKLQHNLDRDLDFAAPQIRTLINEEILKRFYYQKGAIIEQLKDDADLKAAVAVLGDPQKYRQILSAPIKKK